MVRPGIAGPWQEPYQIVWDHLYQILWDEFYHDIDHGLNRPNLVCIELREFHVDVPEASCVVFLAAAASSQVISPTSCPGFR